MYVSLYTMRLLLQVMFYNNDYVITDGDDPVYPGAPLTKGQSLLLLLYQIWPIQCQLIELEPRERKANICLPCLLVWGKKALHAHFFEAIRR